MGARGRLVITWAWVFVAWGIGCVRTEALRCGSDGGCGEGLVCDEAERVCVVPPDAGLGGTGDLGCAGDACPKALGARCTSGRECGSGRCVDGVCCDEPCDATCVACNLTGSPGRCAFVPEGQDPRDTCPAGAGDDARCTPGGCDGKGRCQKAFIGTACAGACTGNTPVLAHCDLAGRCVRDLMQLPCPVCQVCAVTGLAAGCVAAPDTTICVPAGCNSATYNAQVTCKSGSCPPAQYVSCGTYRCYLNAGQVGCLTACGCCSGDVACLAGGEGPKAASCASGTCTDRCAASKQWSCL